MSETFGQVLRRLRLQQGLTQLELGRRSEFPFPGLLGVEADSPGHCPSLAATLRLARGLEASDAERRELLEAWFQAEQWWESIDELARRKAMAKAARRLEDQQMRARFFKPQRRR